MIFVHNDRLRTFHDDIQTVKIVCILTVYIILYGIIFHAYHFIRISVLTDPPRHPDEHSREFLLSSTSKYTTIHGPCKISENSVWFGFWRKENDILREYLGNVEMCIDRIYQFEQLLIENIIE